MKKRIRASLVFVGACMAACGGLTGAEIQAGLRDASRAREKSTLSLAVGETWAGIRTETVTVTPYKYEGGQETPCDQSLAQWNVVDCGRPVGTREIRTTTLRSEILGKSDSASLRQPGFAAIETQQVVIDTQDYFPLKGTSGTTNPKLTLDASVFFTLAEYNGFVVRLSEDQANDDTRGVALYPSSPVPGATYTDDAGMVWTAVGTSKVTVGDKAFGAVDVTAATGRVDLHTLAALRDQCFLKVAAGASMTQVVLKNECRQPFTTAYFVSASVSLDLALDVTAHRESVQILGSGFGIRDANGLVSDFVPTGGTGEFVFVFNKTVEDATFTMSSLAMK